MNATSIIKNAIQKPTFSAPPTETSEEKKEYPVNDLFTSASSKNDMMMKNARRLDRQRKKKYSPVSKWTNTDFLNHIEKTLDLYQIKIEYKNKVYDRQIIDELYDYLADIFGHKMEPQVLKNYIEWWCGCYAFKFRGQEIAVYKLKNYNHLKKFTFEHSDLVIKQEEIDDKGKEIEEENLLDTYRLGGVPSLLMSVGIVDSYRWLSSQDITNPENKIIGTLGSFTDDVLKDIYSKTIKRSPYHGEPLNFISMLRPHMAELDAVEFKQYFV